ncbi:MAG TPA: DinB family protein [candidate division Zixibacteria bacterium]|jgi:uncharacterized damage-inducible protein DinB
MNTDPLSWADYRPWLRAVLDEYARAIRDLEGVLKPVTPDRYVARTELSDEEFPSMREIMWHVIGAANRYVDYINDALDKTDRGMQKHEYAFESTQAAAASLGTAFGRMVEVLGRVRDKTDEDLQPIVFRTRWGQNYDIEQMLEHAIVHILRHRRQLERWLVAAPA